MGRPATALAGPREDRPARFEWRKLEWSQDRFTKMGSGTLSFSSSASIVRGRGPQSIHWHTTSTATALCRPKTRERCSAVQWCPEPTALKRQMFLPCSREAHVTLPANALARISKNPRSHTWCAGSRHVFVVQCVEGSYPSEAWEYDSKNFLVLFTFPHNVGHLQSEFDE